MSDDKDDEITEPDFDIKPGAKILEEDDAELLVGADVLVAPILPEEIEEAAVEDDDEEGLEIDSFDDSDDL